MGETKQGIASPTVKQGGHNASNSLLIQVERKSQLADETAHRIKQMRWTSIAHLFGPAHQRAPPRASSHPPRRARHSRRGSGIRMAARRRDQGRAAPCSRGPWAGSRPGGRTPPRSGRAEKSRRRCRHGCALCLSPAPALALAARLSSCCIGGPSMASAAAAGAGVRRLHRRGCARARTRLSRLRHRSTAPWGGSWRMSCAHA